MSKSGKRVLIIACVIVLLGLGYIVYSNATRMYYKEGNYSEHKCTYSGGWGSRCSDEAVCKVKYYNSINYYCAEHADYGKDFIATMKGYEEERENEKNSSGGAQNSSSEGVCKSCGRQYEAGDAAGNYMNIAKTGMCKNCYNNFNDLKGFLD